jgi:hypothetical protein
MDSVLKKSLLMVSSSIYLPCERDQSCLVLSNVCLRRSLFPEDPNLGG